MNQELKINPSKEKTKIISFIKSVLKKQGFKKVVIGLSGGIDSATSFSLLKESISPNNIIVAHLHHHVSHFKEIEPLIKKAGIPKNNYYDISISPLVKKFREELNIESKDNIRIGNIAARIRMIVLYDLSKKHNALVCGTENKSELLLGYFTRFGDQASDIEPIQHLYKTQVYELAKYLGVPKNIIVQIPTAGLWIEQTDEKEFGFTYKETDEVLRFYFDKKLKLEDIKKKGFKKAEKIINFALKNSYKHHAPYVLGSSIRK